MAEQFALDQLGGRRRAIDFDHDRRVAVAVFVDRARQQFLAGAGFAEQQHRRVSARDHPPKRNGVCNPIPNVSAIFELKNQT